MSLYSLSPARGEFWPLQTGTGCGAYMCVPRGISSHYNFLFGGFNKEQCLRSGTSTVKGSSTTWVSREKNQNIPASLVQMFFLLIYLNFPPTPWNMPWTKVSYLGVQIHFFCWYSPNMTIPSLFSVLPCLVTLPSTFFVLFKSSKVFKQKSSISTSGWASLIGVCLETVIRRVVFAIGEEKPPAAHSKILNPPLSAL